MESSPGINDPFPAMACLDRLAQGLAQVARRAPARTLLRDDQGRPRLQLRPVDAADLVHRSLGPLRSCGRAHLRVILHLLGVVEQVAVAADLEGRQALDRALLEEARMARDDFLANTSHGWERERVESRFLQVERRLARPS